MDLKRTTKAQLAEALDEQRNTIEKLKNEIAILKHNEQRSFNKYRNEQKKVEEASRKINLLRLENISDIKSLQNMLSIHTSQAMTHREKEYLGRKLNQVIQSMVDERIKEIENDLDVNSNLPF